MASCTGVAARFIQIIYYTVRFDVTVAVVYPLPRYAQNSSATLPCPGASGVITRRPCDSDASQSKRWCAPQSFVPSIVQWGFVIVNAFRIRESQIHSNHASYYSDCIAQHYQRVEQSVL